MIPYIGRAVFPCLITISLLIVPAAAAVLLTDFPVVRIYLQKDGVPYMENSSLTITCFGYACDGNDCRESTKERVNTTGLVAFSDICSSFGCTFYRYGEAGGRYTNTRYSRCDLLVSGSGRTYSLTNFSDWPFTNCSIIRPYENSVLTPEYFACLFGEDDKRVQCIHENTSSDTAWEQSCLDTYTRNTGSCRTSGIYPNLSIPEWRGEGFPPRPATEVCDMHIILPPDNRGPEQPLITPSPVMMTARQDGQMPVIVYGTKAPAAASSSDPLRSLYCSVRHLFGGTCE
jgi:hypothetical protein